MTEKKKPGLWAVVASVLAAAIGVQSNKNREQDFESTSIVPYIIGGAIFTVVFIISLVAIANLFLAQAA